MNEAIKSSAKYLDKYHNYLPKSRPLSRHDISTLSLTSTTDFAFSSEDFFKTKVKFSLSAMISIVSLKTPLTFD